MTNITPALTPEQWAAAYERETDASLGFHPVHSELVEAADHGRYHQAQALAHAALPDEHPAKLTWAHVDALQAVLRARSGVGIAPDDVQRTHEVMHAIAALLPPRSA